MFYVTPAGGSSVSGDPISLLRGAPNRETAERFLQFVLSEAGQKLWNYQPGTPGGPRRFALRRLPSRRDFYPSDDPEFAVRHDEHRQYCVDRIGNPDVNPYALAARFTYRPRWTARHFTVHRQLIRAMCLDSGEELKAAWQAILRNGGPEANAADKARLKATGCEVFEDDSPNPNTRLDALLREFGNRKFTNILIEGGGRLAGAFFELGEIDEIHAFIAPKLVSGTGTTSPLAGAGIPNMEEALQLETVECRSLGGDTYITGRIAGGKEGRTN